MLRRTAAAVLLLVLLVPTGLPVRAELAAIRAYQHFGSPLTGRFVTCRFQPTCSHYAIESLETRGFWIGNLKIAGRLTLCSPLGAALDLLSGK